MKNLFLVNSSINLLSTFVLANSKFKDDENYLALVHPHGYDRWHEDAIMSFMFSKEAGFEKVFPLIDKSFGKHLDYVKKEICPIKYDNVFVGNDSGVQNQLLLSALKVSKFYRLDDGLGSYYMAADKRSASKIFFHKMQIKILTTFMGINSDLPINAVGMGHSKAALGDYLLRPELLARYSPSALEITEEMIASALKKLKDHNLLKQELFDRNYIVYLSEPVTEIPKFNFSFDDEIIILKELLTNLDKDTRLIYKPHPNDNPHKLVYIKKNFPEIIINESRVPVEFILYKEPQIKSIISFFCSALVFAPKIAGRPLDCVSLAKRGNFTVDPKYLEMMEKSHVKFI